MRRENKHLLLWYVVGTICCLLHTDHPLPLLSISLPLYKEFFFFLSLMEEKKNTPSHLLHTSATPPVLQTQESGLRWMGGSWFRAESSVCKHEHTDTLCIDPLPFHYYCMENTAAAKAPPTCGAELHSNDAVSRDEAQEVHTWKSLKFLTVVDSNKVHLLQYCTVHFLCTVFEGYFCFVCGNKKGGFNAKMLD